MKSVKYGKGKVWTSKTKLLFSPILPIEIYRNARNHFIQFTPTLTCCERPNGSYSILQMPLFCLLKLQITIGRLKDF